MDNTMLLSDVYTLPSGVEAEIREMSGREEDLFANEQVMKSGKIGQKILGAVILKLGDKKPTSQDIQDMWTADRSAALLYTRILTFGESITSEVECTNDDCETHISVHVDSLLEDLGTKPPPEEFEKLVDLPGGMTARIRPGKGSDEEKLAQARRKGELITEMLFTRTLEISGIESRQELKHFLADGSLRVRRALTKAINEHDFGIETGIEVTCPVCGTEQTVDVQSMTSFFFPENADSQ